MPTLLQLPQQKIIQSFSVEVLIDRSITSQIKDHRRLLRKSLMEELKLRGQTGPTQAILDLESLPVSKGYSISLSHSPGGSAIALARGQAGLGIDIEVKSRLDLKIINRLATQKEIDQSLDPRHLFSAKEAAWKALFSNLPSVTVSQIEISQWSQVGSDWFGFNVLTNGKKVSGEGFLWEDSSIYLALFISPQLLSGSTEEQ